MSISWCSPRKALASAGLAILSMLSIPALGLAQGPTISGLPESVTGTQAQVPLSGPTGPTYSTFLVSSPPTGTISVAGNPYNVWCWNPYGYIEPTPQTYTAYSSYDTNFLALPGAGSATAWQEINWVINHKHGESGNLNPTVTDIQEVIWNLLISGYDTNDFSADGAQLLSDAQTYGSGFVPGGGQLLAIPLYVGGINPDDTPYDAQDILIEYPLPNNPNIQVAKTASVTTAKCADKVTYTYTVTNTGNVTLTNVTVVDDNATPNYSGDDITIASGVTLQPGQSQTYTRTLYLPVTEYGVDAYGHSSSHTLITQVLPNGNLQLTLLEDLSLIDNSYGIASSPDWGTQGNSLLSHLGQDSAEFEFVDGNGNVVLDFAADYVSFSPRYPSGFGTAGVYGGAGQLFWGNPSNIVSIDTTLTDNLNQNGRNSGFLWNSPPPNYPNWKFQCGYTVVIKPSCFGAYGYGGCHIKKIQHGKCKFGGYYQCKPVPLCKAVTNTATVTATAGNATITAIAHATVQLTPGGQQSCQAPPTCQCPCWNCQHGDHQHCHNPYCHDQQCQQQHCQCPCWNCQHGDHQHCQNANCHDQQCQQQHCPQQQCRPSCSRPQDWWKQCNQQFQQCGRSW